MVFSAGEQLVMRGSNLTDVVGATGGLGGEGSLDVAQEAAVALKAASAAVDATKEAFSSTAASSLNAVSGGARPVSILLRKILDLAPQNAVGCRTLVWPSEWA